jgi:hypothetical protein
MTKAALDDHIGAIYAFDDAIKYRPDFAMAFYYRGINKSSIHYPEGALLDFDECVN